MATSDSSDFEVTELHIHFLTQKQADGMVRRRHYHEYAADCCPVLLPNYRLSYAPVLHFYLKKLGPLAFVRAEGVEL